MIFKFLTNITDSRPEDGNINPVIIRRVFNRTKNLMFDSESASLEEKAVLEMIEDIPNKRVLDLGCGDGRYSAVIQNYD